MAEYNPYDPIPVKLVGHPDKNNNVDAATLQRSSSRLTASSTTSIEPEDAAFDHRTPADKTHTNLVRGASTRSKSPYSLDGGEDKRGGLADDYYKDSKHARNDSDSSLVGNAAGIAGATGRTGNYQDLEYADPYSTDQSKGAAENTSAFAKLMGAGKYPLGQRIEDKKRGIGRQRYPFVVWLLSVIMVCVFIFECVKNSNEQGSPVSFKPVVNYMLGPSSAALINVGARFPACMKDVKDIPPTMQMGCMNNTENPATEICTVEELCGFGGFHSEAPNQWFRFITPIFIHAGFVHIALNLFAQLSLSAQIEREMGSGGFFFTYMAAGIFGNVFGGSFSLVGIPSVGASGAIFGTVAVTWVDLLAHWKYQYRPVRKLIFMILELAIGIAIGFIPYVDNFAHIGGFLMGLLVGMFFYPVISETKRHKMITWGFRIAALPLAIILFVVLTRNFYTSDPYAACEWCRYLSCWPTDSNDHCKGTGLSTSRSS